MIALTLNIDPVPFDRPRFCKGRVFNSKKYASFKTHARCLMRNMYQEKPIAREVPIKVAVHFWIERPKSSKRKFPTVRPDGDNFLKAILDCGNEILWHDDASICEMAASKRYADVGRIVLEIDRILDI